MSYVGMGAAAFGQDCPGQEKWDATIGACMCPPGTAPDAMSTGKCVSPAASEASFKKWKSGAGTCKPNVKGQKMCLCPAGTAYDESRDMCTAEQLAKGYPSTASWRPQKPCPSGFILDDWDPNFPCIPDPAARRPAPVIVEEAPAPEVRPEKKLSTAAILGIGVAALGVVGLAYAAKKKRK